MEKYNVGSHLRAIGFDCFDCALNYYGELTGKKYLSESEVSGKVKKIIENTYGWKNE